MNLNGSCSLLTLHLLNLISLTWEFGQSFWWRFWCRGPSYCMNLSLRKALGWSQSGHPVFILRINIIEIIPFHYSGCPRIPPKFSRIFGGIREHPYLAFHLSRQPFQSTSGGIRGHPLYYKNKPKKSKPPNSAAHSRTNRKSPPSDASFPGKESSLPYSSHCFN